MRFTAVSRNWDSLFYQLSQKIVDMYLDLNFPGSLTLSNAMKDICTYVILRIKPRTGLGPLFTRPNNARKFQEISGYELLNDRCINLCLAITCELIASSSVQNESLMSVI